MEENKSNNTWLWWGAIALVAVVVIYFLGRGTSLEGGPIKIGFIGPLTGDAATIGEGMKVAIEIARDEVNSAGGINGRQVEVIFEDGQCNPQAAANAGNKLINIDKVPVIIGGACSSETLAVAPLAESAKVLLFSAASTNPKIADAGDYIFRNVPSDSFQGSFAAEYIKNNLGLSRVALLKCLSDWCLGVNDAFKARFLELGGQIVAEESFEQTSRDLRTQLSKIKAASPQAIYFVSYTEATIPGLRQAKELGIKATIFGADAWSDPKIWTELGQTGDGAMYVEPANKDLPESFITEMNRRTGGAEINVYAPRAYDAFKILASIMRSKGVNATAIKTALYELKDYQGIADSYTFDGRGEIVKAAYAVKRVQGGKALRVQ
jgi:branched-chain amino acid transport system substrate-binding protein